MATTRALVIKLLSKGGNLEKFISQILIYVVLLYNLYNPIKISITEFLEIQ